MGCDGGETQRQPLKLRGVPAGDSVSAELVHKLDGARDWGAPRAVRAGDVPGRRAALVCGDTGRTDSAHDVGE